MTHSTDALFLHYTTSYNRHVRSWDGHVVKGLLCYPAPNKEELKNRAVFVCLFPGVAYPWQPIFPGGFTFLAMWQQEDWSPWIQIWPILFIFCQVTRIFLVDFFFFSFAIHKEMRRTWKNSQGCILYNLHSVTGVISKGIFYLRDPSGWWWWSRSAFPVSAAWSVLSNHPQRRAVCRDRIWGWESGLQKEVDVKKYIWRRLRAQSWNWMSQTEGYCRQEAQALK